MRGWRRHGNGVNQPQKDEVGSTAGSETEWSGWRRGRDIGTALLVLFVIGSGIYIRGCGSKPSTETGTRIAPNNQKATTAKPAPGQYKLKSDGPPPGQARASGDAAPVQAGDGNSAAPVVVGQVPKGDASSSIDAILQNAPVRFAARHKEFGGGCDGELTLRLDGLHFKCATGDAIDVPIRAIERADNDGILLTNGKKYHFEIAGESKALVEAQFSTWFIHARSSQPGPGDSNRNATAH
jgi:hypothetical protein